MNGGYRIFYLYPGRTGTVFVNADKVVYVEEFEKGATAVIHFENGETVTVCGDIKDVVETLKGE